MAGRMKLEIAESVEYLEKTMKHARSAAQKERLLLLWWVKSGEVTQHQELAARLGRNPSTITRWLQKYRQGGLKALLEVKVAPGAKPLIAGQVKTALEERLSTEQGFGSYGEIVEWLQNSFNLTLKYATVRRFVRDELKAKLKVPRPQSVHQHPEAINQFKKNIRLAVMEFQALFQLKQPLRYLCQDETRIGRKTQTARVITAHGVKPIAKVQWPREAFWLYGIVEPYSGWQFTQEYEKLNSTNFQAFIDAISEQLGDTIAVIQIDGAPAHRAKALEWPENLIPVFQPPHSPEVNPIERLWEFLKSLWKGENFASLQELRERVTKELEMLTPEQIQSLTSYNFILDTLLATKFEPAEFHLVQA